MPEKTLNARINSGIYRAERGTHYRICRLTRDCWITHTGHSKLTDTAFIAKNVFLRKYNSTINTTGIDPADLEESDEESEIEEGDDDSVESEDQEIERLRIDNQRLRAREGLDVTTNLDNLEETVAKQAGEINNLKQELDNCYIELRRRKDIYDANSNMVQNCSRCSDRYTYYTLKDDQDDD